jgi:hypothetical protein
MEKNAIAWNNSLHAENNDKEKPNNKNASDINL